MSEDKSKEPGNDGAKEPKAKAADKAPEPLTFRDADYHGPLTGDQAAWRNANLKPASAKTK